MTDLFTTDGLAAWRGHLSRSRDFAEAAEGWSGSLLLRDITPSDEVRRAWILLDAGSLREFRLGTMDDEVRAEFVLAASTDVWDGLVSGERDLSKTALSGELRLERGSIMRLLPHARAAAELLRGGARDR